MASLFKHLRVHQIFGASTNVGKTILTTALAKASAKDKATYYLKPVSTGPDSDSDDTHVRRYAGGSKLTTETLWRYKDPVSPHLAAEIAVEQGHEGKDIPTDDIFVTNIREYIHKCAALSNHSLAHMYIETAGGVHSPTLSATTQVDAYRPLLIPTLLVGSSQLGGISATLSAYESLVLRGYTIDAILLFHETYYRNSEYLTSYFDRQRSNVAVYAISEPPPRIEDPSEDSKAMHNYYENLLNSGEIGGISEHLDTRHARRIEELGSLPSRTLDTIWWPFVQHGLVKDEQDITVIDSAHSDFFSVSAPSKGDDGSILRPLLDCSASWWTQALGHSHPSLTLAAARAAGRYGHVMFPQATHLPALELAERLINDGPGRGWAAKAFFSDNGSTAVEIALKMALRAFCIKEGIGKDRVKGDQQLGVLGLKGSYHGDTIGAMNACEEGVYTCEWHNARGYWFDPPTVSIRDGKVALYMPDALNTTQSSPTSNPTSLSWVYDVAARLKTPLASHYQSYISRTLASIKATADVRLAALVLEPLVMGAGGMIFVDPLFQRVLVDVVRQLGHEADRSPSQWRGLPVIFDEVFAGLYRLGMQSTIATLGVTPDISVNAKILTGGMVPLAVTLASQSIFQAFWSEKKTDALLHGHSYTAHAIGCEIANETLEIIGGLAKEVGGPWDAAKKSWAESSLVGNKTIWSFWDPTFVEALSREKVIAEVMALGTVLAFKVNDSQGGYSSQAAQTLLKSLTIANLSDTSEGNSYGIHLRTLGNIAYFMSSLNTSASTFRAVEHAILTRVQSLATP